MAKNQQAPAETSESTNPPAPTGDVPAGFAKFDPSKVKIVNHVTRPVLQLLPNVPVFVKAESAIYEGKAIEGKRGDGEMKPAELMEVIDLTTGEHMVIVCGTVLANELRENYPNDGYKGKAFRILKGQRKGKEGGRGYFTYSIAEIAL